MQPVRQEETRKVTQKPNETSGFFKKIDNHDIRKINNPIKKWTLDLK